MLDHSDITQASLAVRDPATSAADLAAITQAQPSLWAEVARHPNAYPALLDWLDLAGDKRVRAAVAARRRNPTTPPDTPDFLPATPPGGNSPSTIGLPPGADSLSAPSAIGFLPATSPGAGSPSTAPSPIGFQARPTGQPFPPLTPDQPVQPIQPARPARRRKPLVIGLTLAVVLVVLALVVWFLAKPRLAPAGEGRYAPDLAAEPVASPAADLTATMDPAGQSYYSLSTDDPLVASTGLALVKVDYEAFSRAETDPRWHEGYDQEYDQGYADGLACSQEPEPPRNSLDHLTWSVWPQQYCLVTLDPPVGDADRYKAPDDGYFDGYDDGLRGTKDANRAPAPATLGQAPRLIGFSLDDGASLWEEDLSQTGVAHPTVSPVSWSDLGRLNTMPSPDLVANGEGRVALVVADGLDPTAAGALLVVDAADGEIVSTTALPAGPNRAAGYSGSSVLIWSTTPATGATALTCWSDAGELRWTHQVAGAIDPSSRPARVVDQTWVDAGDAFVSLADGSPAGFGVDLAEGVTYYPTPDGSLWRLSRDTGATTLTRWDPNQDRAQWKEPIVADSSVMTGDSQTLYGLKGETLTAYTLTSGKAVWSAAVPGAMTVIGAAGDTVLLYSAADGLELFDASRHEVAATIPIDSGGVYCGRETIYLITASAFSALDASGASATPRWSLGISPTTVIGLIGDVFIAQTADGHLSVLH